jgi:hypothetical protein
MTTLDVSMVKPSETNPELFELLYSKNVCTPVPAVP